MSTLPTRFRRNALANYANSFVTLALALIVTPILVRGLGKEAYGTWVLVTSLVLYFDLLKFGFSKAAIKPSVVCSFASNAGSSFSARMVLLVSGPIEAIFSRGNFFTSFGRSNRA